MIKTAKVIQDTTYTRANTQIDKEQYLAVQLISLTGREGVKRVPIQVFLIYPSGDLWIRDDVLRNTNGFLSMFTFIVWTVFSPQKVSVVTVSQYHFIKTHTFLFS